MQHKKVVITGLGAVTPLGLDVESFWQGLVTGTSGIGPITQFDASALPVRIAGELKGFQAEKYLDKKLVRRMDPYLHYAFAAASEALAQAGVTRAYVEANDPERFGILIGSGIGGMQTFNDQAVALHEGGYKKISPFFIPAMIPNMAAGMLAIEYNMQGPNFSISTACATASHSLYTALNLVRLGEADLMVVGGAEAAVCPLGMSGFISEHAVSTRNDEPAKASRPFDVGRDGFVMGEGAGVLVIETEESARRRGATILAELAGAGVSCDAFHMTAPRDDGGGGAQAMRNTLRNAGVAPTDVQYINTHGTSTPLGDIGETKAIKTVFGDHAYKLKINSTKSMTGHLLGAAGGIEAVACVKTILTGTVHPTINLDQPDPECDLDYVPHRAVQYPVDVAISNSFGFGGHNACVCFRRYAG